MKVYRYSISKGLKFAVLFTSIVLFASILPSIGSEGQDSQMEEDEKQLWKDAIRTEKKLEKSSFLLRNPELEAYLNSLLKKLLQPGSEIQTAWLRVRIIKSPHLGAFALPNGAIYVCMGVLVIMENEAQLATILGHELAHVLGRHTLKELGRTPRYSQKMEKEADEEGLRAMARVGFDLRQAPKALEHLVEEDGNEENEVPFYLATHPRLRERIKNYQSLIRTPGIRGLMAANPVIGREEYEKRIEGLLLDNAVMDIDLGRSKLAKRAIERRLRQNSQDPRAHFLMGELHRKSEKGNPQALDLAISSYQTAIRLDPLYAEPHREIGFLYRIQNQKEKWRSEFEEYLALNPKAIDAPIIKGYLDQQ